MSNFRASIGGIYQFHNRSCALEFTAVVVLNPKKDGNDGHLGGPKYSSGINELNFHVNESILPLVA